jgi:hypothetical protein
VALGQGKVMSLDWLMALVAGVVGVVFSPIFNK